MALQHRTPHTFILGLSASLMGLLGMSGCDQERGIQDLALNPYQPPVVRAGFSQKQYNAQFVNSFRGIAKPATLQAAYAALDHFLSGYVTASGDIAVQAAAGDPYNGLDQFLSFVAERADTKSMQSQSDAAYDAFLLNAYNGWWIYATMQSGGQSPSLSEYRKVQLPIAGFGSAQQATLAQLRQKLKNRAPIFILVMPQPTLDAHLAPTLPAYVYDFGADFMTDVTHRANENYGRLIAAAKLQAYQQGEAPVPALMVEYHVAMAALEPKSTGSDAAAAKLSPQQQVLAELAQDFNDVGFSVKPSGMAEDNQYLIVYNTPQP